MLSYQHSYHAGNFADCHKHAVLCALLTTLQTKDSAITCHDFFAGRGMYALHGPEATKTGEYIDGIAKLWATTGHLPDALRPYADAVRHYNADALLAYPGSPVFMANLLRPQDRLICNDAHPQEFHALERALPADPRIAVHHRDAWEAMQALLPPRGADKTPRGLVVLDPAYEVKSDYTVLVEACAWALEKFRHGVYLIWYPLLPANHHKTMLGLFQQHIQTKTLHSQLIVRDANGFGMYGSGLLLINPPWQFDGMVSEIGDYLSGHLAQDRTAHHTLAWLVEEKTS